MKIFQKSVLILITATSAAAKKGVRNDEFLELCNMLDKNDEILAMVDENPGMSYNNLNLFSPTCDSHQETNSHLHHASPLYIRSCACTRQKRRYVLIGCSQTSQFYACASFGTERC